MKHGQLCRSRFYAFSTRILVAEMTIAIAHQTSILKISNSSDDHHMTIIYLDLE
jgi:hypothetical protein